MNNRLTILKCSLSHPQEQQQSQDQRQVEVELRNVSLSYGGKKVIDNLNLSIYRGESVAIIGTSGTGKSTTLRLISGLEMPTEGDIFLRGQRRKMSIVESILKAQKQSKNNPFQISMVFQNAALFDSLSIGENVAFKLHSKSTTLTQDEIYELTNEWLDRVDLSDSFDKLPEQLSGGMKKRASFARAVIFDPNDASTAPDILLYDEPTAGLDPTASTRIENLIRELQQFCPTCVVVTHQFSTIRRTADRVVFLHGGSAIWEGTVEQMETTDNPYVIQFMTASLEGPLFSADEITGPTNSPLQLKVLNEEIS